MVDNVGAARRAVCHLTRRGHRRIAMVTASATLATSVARLAGYREALADVGVTAPDRWVRIADGSPPSTRAAGGNLLALPESDRPTAIFATDSLLTAGIFRAVQDVGLVIPDDVSVLGFDDVDWMTMVRPAVTVVDQPMYELGRQAAERLMARIEDAVDDSSPRQVQLDTHLILRGSCAVPRVRPRRSCHPGSHMHLA